MFHSRLPSVSNVEEGNKNLLGEPSEMTTTLHNVTLQSLHYHTHVGLYFLDVPIRLRIHPKIVRKSH